MSFARQDADIGIRSGGGNSPGMIAHKIFGADFTPMLSPVLAATIGGVNTPMDFLKLPIVDPSDRRWKIWFAAVGVADPELRGNPRHPLAISILKERQLRPRSSASVTPAFFETELKSGLLIQPFDIVGNDDHFYWLVYPEARRNVPKVRAFRDWLLEQLVDRWNSAEQHIRPPKRLKNGEIAQQ